jgi:serine/threonine protein kinase
MPSYEKDWQIESELPGGGQSFTYIVTRKGEDSSDNFVLKRNKNPKRELRFRTEVKALIELEHEKIAKIIASDLDDENPWYIQKYYSGGDLEQYIIGNPQASLSNLFDIFIQICEGLWYCHSSNIFHRDIKPANIFIDSASNKIVIGDFGLCWLPSSSPRLTTTAERIGSWHFIPPEYRDGRVEEPTAKGDVYSLGKVLYFLMSGGKSFDREDHRDKRWDLVQVNSTPTPSWPINLYLEHVNLLLDQMIVQDPEKRYSVESIWKNAQTAKRLVLEKFNLIRGAKYAPCNYCGLGYYQPVASSTGTFAKFLGLQIGAINTENEGFRALKCDYCGHVQIFHLPNPGNDWISGNATSS